MAGDPHPVFQDGTPPQKSNARAYLPLTLGNPDALRALDGTSLWLAFVLSLRAQFYRDPSDTTSEDNGTTVIVDAAGQRWKAVPGGGGGDITGPAETTSGHIPTWNAADGSALGAGHPASYFAAQAADGTTSAVGIGFASDPDTGHTRPANNTMAAVVGGAEAYRLDSSGRFIKGNTKSVSVAGGGNHGAIQCQGATSNEATFSFIRWAASAFGAQAIFAKSRGALNVNVALSENDYIGRFIFSGSGASGFPGVDAEIRGMADANYDTNVSARLDFMTSYDGSPVHAQRCAGNGAIHFPAIGTTASAANAFLDSGSTPANQLLRSTSSLTYKYDVEALEAERATAFLGAAEAIWYRSKAAADKFADGSAKSFYSFGAEPMSEIDPRLVTWGYRDEDWETVTIEEPEEAPLTETVEVEDVEVCCEAGRAVLTPVTRTVEREVVETLPLFDADGAPVLRDGVQVTVTRPVMQTVMTSREERRLKEGAQLVPDGINDRAVIAMLTRVVQMQEARIAALEASQIDFNHILDD